MIIARPKQRRQKAPSFHGKGPQGKLADLPWCREARRVPKPCAGASKDTEELVAVFGGHALRPHVVAAGIDQRSAAALKSAAAESCSTPAPANMETRCARANNVKAASAAARLRGIAPAKKLETGAGV